MSASARVEHRPSLTQAGPFRVVLSTAGSIAEAKLLARAIIQKRLAACVNLIPGLQSWYWWKGRVTSDQEVLLVIKTNRTALGRLLCVLRSHHSYDLPEFLAMPITHGDLAYLKWIEENVSHP